MDDDERTSCFNTAVGLRFLICHIIIYAEMYDKEELDGTRERQRQFGGLVLHICMSVLGNQHRMLQQRSGSAVLPYNHYK